MIGGGDFMLRLGWFKPDFCRNVQVCKSKRNCVLDVADDESGAVLCAWF